MFLKQIQMETDEWPGQPYRFEGSHRRWNADRFYNEYIIDRCDQDDRDDDDRYCREFWCIADVEIIAWTDQKVTALVPSL